MVFRKKFLRESVHDSPAGVRRMDTPNKNDFESCPKSFKPQREKGDGGIKK